MIMILPLIAVILLMLPFIRLYKGIVTKKQIKRRMIFNISGFFGVLLLAIILPIGDLVQAASSPENANIISTDSLAYIGAALSIGLSALGAGIAVAAAAPAAIGACSEDPKAFGKSLIFVALGEGVALYGLLISILILNKA